MSINPNDLIGLKRGLLLVVSIAAEKQHTDSRGKVIRYYNCLCDCGEKTVVSRGALAMCPSRKSTRSCGCLRNRGGSANPGWTGHGEISGYLWARIRNGKNRTSRTLPFTITKEYVWELFEKQQGRCAFTGWPLSIDLSSKRKSTRTASLDRIDSALGYVPGNVHWVHKDVNQIKWDLHRDRFIKVCRAVVSYQGSQNE